MVRSSVVGMLNAAVYYGLYLLFKRMLPYSVANMVVLGLAMVGSYFLDCYFTFRTNPRCKRSCSSRCPTPPTS